MLWVSSLEFDLSIFDIFGILGPAARSSSRQPTATSEPHRWAEAVHAHSVTLWNSVPALAELMLSAAGDEAAVLLASLRVVMLSGDWIPVTLAGRLRRQFLTARLLSLGGATEASIWSILHPIDAESTRAGSSSPTASRCANQTFHVLKQDFSPCPMHTTGKLFIGGAGLALGYWNNPEQTNGALRASPGHRRAALRHG